MQHAKNEAMSALSISLCRAHDWDQGWELTRNEMDMYFSDPHSPWERGTNETPISLLDQQRPPAQSCLHIIAASRCKRIGLRNRRQQMRPVARAERARYMAIRVPSSWPGFKNDSAGAELVWHISTRRACRNVTVAGTAHFRPQRARSSAPEL